MANERAILCGEVPVGNLPLGRNDPLQLHLWGKPENVRLQVNDIRSHLLQDIPSPFHDLVEIATYVYVADQATTRGGDGVDVFGENWRRRLFFRIPVRNPDFWNQDKVRSQLVGTLSFLSEDEYFFEFVKLTGEPPAQRHLDFGVDAPDEVVLFSGGLDSLGGAIQEAVVDNRHVALVTHKPTQKLARRHRKLEELLAAKAAHAPLHIPVVINKDKGLGREYTQRSRSFLYAALGGTVARMFGLSRIRFYENGVVSFNLPVSAQVVGSRATRTTHPQVINGFAGLLSLVADQPFTVENPFLWKTKADVIKLITDTNCEEMIRFATSCTHTWEMTKLKTHCGTCSQCIDRRFAILSAKADPHDPAEAYGVDLLTGEREAGEPRTMLASYVETASEVADMSALDFFGRFGEASRVLRHLNGSPDTTALQLYQLHQRHAKGVTDAVDNAIAQHRKAIRKRLLPDSCLLRLVCDSSLPGGTAGAAENQTSVELASENSIHLKGEYWTVRFGGNEEKIYKPDIGFQYLKLLLENPGATFTASQLDCQVRKYLNGANCSGDDGNDHTPENSVMLDRSDGQDMIDADYKQSLLSRRGEIEGLIEAARESGEVDDIDEIDELESEKLAIDSVLSKAKGYGGRTRKIGDERNKVRNRVCNAVRRALKKITKYDKPLGEHLQRPILSLGHSLSYVPRDGVEWNTEAPTDCA